jgi:hypothetical protein
MLCDSIGLRQAKKRFEADSYFAINSNVGIEVELEHVRLKLDRDLWDYTQDGSLRDGVEYISNGPINGKGLSSAINNLHIAGLRKGVDADYCCNHRCSTHIHVDMTDLQDEQQLFTFILLALFMEPLLFSSFDSKLRENSNYCVPLYAQDKYLQVLNDSLRNNILTPLSLFSQKYSSINLRRLVGGVDDDGALGTIEFRMFPSTLDGNTLRLWVNILLSMKKYAVTHTVEDVRQLSRLLSSQGTTEFLTEIFGSECAALLIPFADYSKMLQGARTVGRVLFDPNAGAIERLFDREPPKRASFLSRDYSFDEDEGNVHNDDEGYDEDEPDYDEMVALLFEDEEEE